MNGIVTVTEEEETPERKKRRSFGDAACVSGCLSLQAGFVLICCWALAWAVALLLLTEAIWKILYYTDWVLYLSKHFFYHDDEETLIKLSKLLVADFEYWTWWSTWVDGLLLLLVALLGFWGLGGCCLGTHLKRVRQNALVLAACWLLSIQWFLGCCVVIGFPIWLRVKRHISLFSWKLGLCYAFFLALPVFCGGFWLCDGAFSFYFVLKVGGTGLEMKNATDIRRQKQRQDDDLIDDLDELSERRPLIDNLSASDLSSDAPHGEAFHYGAHEFGNANHTVIAVGRIKNNSPQLSYEP